LKVKDALCAIKTLIFASNFFLEIEKKGKQHKWNLLKGITDHKIWKDMNFWE